MNTITDTIKNIAHAADAGGMKLEKVQLRADEYTVFQREQGARDEPVTYLDTVRGRTTVVPGLSTEVHT